jgi:tellurite resistance protein TerC
VALAFNGLVWWWRGQEQAVTFLTGYVLEKALSVDNVFVFAVIFRFFQVPLKYQYRVLFWGILGAIVLRFVFVFAGTTLIHYFDWVLPLFGLLLIYTAYRLAFQSGEEVHPDQNPVLRFARRFFRVSRGGHEEHGHSFFVRQAGKMCITPMFLVLLVVESTDVVFAVDSIPAIIGITRDTFLVFTSNIFAILGLRALYFLLAGVIDMFRYLHYGLSAVLAFIGVTMIAEYWFKPAGVEEWHLMPIWAKLSVIAGVLALSIVSSILAKKREEPAEDKTQEA